jgi:exodeoxyribonuclease VII large subunit
MPVLTVSELTKNIKILLEESFSQISVVGEISNFKPHYSGHWYFNLKDSDAVISCTMWKGLNSFVFFTPQDGMKVIVSGRLTVYPPRGNYQIDVRSMKPAGAGELQAAFEALKQKLSGEGLFDEEHKKSIPEIPQKIGIVTAIDGAALKDMISVAKRRFPVLELIIAPARVQGSGAAEEIVAAINQLNETDADVIIIARGGGSIEDLWAFNEEIVARAIYTSQIPVISGVGHEIDFTIADFVADLRAPTPTAAMELATPNKTELISSISGFTFKSFNDLIFICNQRRHRIFDILKSYSFRVPADIIKTNNQKIDHLITKLFANIDLIFMHNKNKLLLIGKVLDSNDIQKQLRKGFVIVKQNSRLVKRKSDFNPEQTTELNFYDGNVNINKI